MIQRLEDNIEKHEGLMTAIRNDTDNTMDNSMTRTTRIKAKMGRKKNLWSL